MNLSTVKEFEDEVAQFFGAPYGVAVDSCTHGIELSLRHLNVKSISVPKHTYISIPFLSNKLNIGLVWRDEEWKDYYYLSHSVIDAAVLWKPNSYIPDTLMSISFQYQKHLSLGRGGMILTDNEDTYQTLKKMSYDGRLPDVPWREQNIDIVGYHYYMTPETAQIGLNKLSEAIATQSRQWNVSDWPDLTQMEIFK
jgi:dTDP-4-amino-4,6-dideoxygalactose transaminase